MIYFIQKSIDGPVKIGKTVNLKQRLKALRTETDVPLRVLGIIMEGYTEKEAELHQQFSIYQVEGEWFSPNPKLLAYILKNADHILTEGIDHFIEPNQPMRIPIASKVSPKCKHRLNELSFYLKSTKRDVIELAINRLYEFEIEQKV